MAGSRASFTVPPLLSGGVMLSYRCTSACQHCLYRCSPQQPDEWLSLQTAERVFRALQAEPLEDIHLAGGEPTIQLKLLTDIIRLAVKMGIPLSYVETNAGWCTDRGRAEAGMRALREAGLPAVLVSVSMFHNEFVPFRNTRHGVEAAHKVFGRGGTLIYLPQLYYLLSQMPDDGRHRLEEFARAVGIEDQPAMLLALYQVIPSGRAVDALRHCYTAHPAEHYARRCCFADLSSTSHFHIDHYGNLFTGLCAGLVPATIDDLHPRITSATHPVFHRLAQDGPYGLMGLAQDRHGYQERERGYVSKCDLCLDVRRCLQQTGQYPELRPASFYA